MAACRSTERVESSATDALACLSPREEVLDGVQPRPGCRREIDVPASDRSVRPSSFTFGCLMGD